jgi:hypothetical protein
MLASQYIVLFGSAVNFLGALSYIKDTLSGRTKPNRVSWLLWSVAPLIGAFAAFADGVTWAALPVFVAGFTPLLVFISSFANRKAYWKLGTFDYLCGFFSLLALVLWAATSSPPVAIVFAILGDFFAAVPTLAKSWRRPDTESSIAYVTGGISALTAFAAVQAWSFSEYAFPAYLVVMNCVFVLLIVRKK